MGAQDVFDYTSVVTVLQGSGIDPFFVLLFSYLFDWGLLSPLENQWTENGVIFLLTPTYLFLVLIIFLLQLVDSPSEVHFIEA